MQRGKLYNLHQTALLTIERFFLQKQSNWKQPNFDVAKKTFLAHDGFVFYHPSFHLSSVLETKSATVRELYYEKCKAFDAASFDIFYFCKKVK